MNYCDFCDDTEKMRDFYVLSKTDFLLSYSYLTEEEYDLTLEKVKQGNLRERQLTVALMNWIEKYATEDALHLKEALMDDCGMSKEEVEERGFGYIFDCLESPTVERKNMWVCEHCLCGIEAHEGKRPTLKHYIDEGENSVCDFCEEGGFLELYELI